MREFGARYGHDHGVWYIELEGDLRYTMAPALNALLDRAFAAADTRRFLIDLSAAETIDSTCLGVLVRIAVWARDKGAPQPTIVTTNRDITETLLSVCFDRLFELRGEAVVATGGLSAVDDRTVDTDEMSQMVLKAHQRLSAIDDVNATAFRDVIEILERDVARRRQLSSEEG